MRGQARNFKLEMVADCGCAGRGARLRGMKHAAIPEDAGLRPDPFAPTVIRLRQAVRASFRAVVGEVPLILRVDQGRKVIRGAMDAEVFAGSLALMPAGLALDVENHPAAEGPYRATGLLIPASVAAPRGRAGRMQTDDPRALQAFDRALELARRAAVPQAIRDHAVAEVLLWLESLGLRLPELGPGLGPEPVALRVRVLAGQDLSRDWPAPEVARLLGMSEATLRRRLAAEATGLAALMTDLRMNRALGLLQATDLPVGVIAAEVGYASASRFAMRFRARFGLSPTALRGDDRNGTEIERQGTGLVGGAQ